MTIYLYATKFMTLPAYTSPLAIFIYTDRVCFSLFGILGHLIPSRPSFSFQLLRKHWSFEGGFTSAYRRKRNRRFSEYQVQIPLPSHLLFVIAAPL
jgi:hypothetical protein